MKTLSCVVVAGLSLVCVSAFADPVQQTTVNVSVTDINTTHNVLVTFPRSADFLMSDVGPGVTLGGAFTKGAQHNTDADHKTLNASFSIGQGQYTKFFFNVKRDDLFGWGCTISTTVMPDGTITAAKGSEPTCKDITLGVSGNNIGVTYLDTHVGAA